MCITRELNPFTANSVSYILSIVQLEPYYVSNTEIQSHDLHQVWSEGEGPHLLMDPVSHCSLKGFSAVTALRPLDTSCSNSLGGSGLRFTPGDRVSPGSCNQNKLKHHNLII